MFQKNNHFQEAIDHWYSKCASLEESHNSMAKQLVTLVHDRTVLGEEVRFRIAAHESVLKEKDSLALQLALTSSQLKSIASSVESVSLQALPSPPMPPLASAPTLLSRSTQKHTSLHSPSPLQKERERSIHLEMKKRSDFDEEFMAKRLKFSSVSNSK